MARGPEQQPEIDIDALLEKRANEAEVTPNEEALKRVMEKVGRRRHRLRNFFRRKRA